MYFCLYLGILELQNILEKFRNRTNSLLRIRLHQLWLIERSTQTSRQQRTTISDWTLKSRIIEKQHLKEQWIIEAIGLDKQGQKERWMFEGDEEVRIQGRVSEDVEEPQP